MKLITEGEFQISDESGKTVGVIYFPLGTKATYTTQSYGVGFYVSGSWRLR